MTMGVGWGGGGGSTGRSWTLVLTKKILTMGGAGKDQKWEGKCTQLQCLWPYYIRNEFTRQSIYTSDM